MKQANARYLAASRAGRTMFIGVIISSSTSIFMGITARVWGPAIKPGGQGLSQNYLTKPDEGDSEMKGIKGKKVLVTGGSSGIGQAIAIKFAEYGADVAINFFRNRAEAEATEQALDWCRNRVQQYGGKDMLIQADVGQKADVDRMFDEIFTEWGTLDFLINNAGIQFAADSHEVEIEKFIRVINTNTIGAFMCAQHAIQHWLKEDKSGVIINVSSVHQIIPKPRFVGYSVSKGGMQNLTQTLALEYAGRKIRVNAIGPGATVTPINRAWIDDPEKKAMVESHIPMGRAGEAEEMAEAAAFLCSDLAAYITGQTLFVDGGLTLYPDFREAWSSE
jgi:glucose 1-dehydrogenase